MRANRDITVTPLQRDVHCKDTITRGRSHYFIVSLLLFQVF